MYVRIHVCICIYTCIIQLFSIRVHRQEEEEEEEEEEGNQEEEEEEEEEFTIATSFLLLPFPTLQNLLHNKNNIHMYM